MKSVLVSNRPQWCEKICHEIGKDENGKPIYEKEIEMRKSKPNEVPFKAYIYCTKEHANEIVLLKDYKNRFSFGDYRNADDHFYSIANGRIIGEFICGKVDEYVLILDYNGDNYATSKGWRAFPFKEACLSQEEIVDYGKGKTLYGWHISDLKIYDKPKELSEFNRPCVSPTHDCEECLQGGTPYTWDFDEEKGKIYCTRRVKTPPQSWCYVEEL